MYTFSFDCKYNIDCNYRAYHCDLLSEWGIPNNHPYCRNGLITFNWVNYITHNYLLKDMCE